MVSASDQPSIPSPGGGLKAWSCHTSWGCHFFFPCPQQTLNSLVFMLSQMPVTFEDVALYLSREEWGRLDHTQQNFYRDILQGKNGLALGKAHLQWLPVASGVEVCPVTASLPTPYLPFPLFFIWTALLCITFRTDAHACFCPRTVTTR